jgi:hypothetical protein
LAGAAVSDDNGRAAVVGAAVTGASARIARDAAAAEGDQLPMFEAPTRFHGPRAAAVQAAIERRSGPGRPPGAVNKSTKAMREYLLGRGINPLVALMRYALMPPDLLAAELGCSKLEAFREWRSLQDAIAPYLFGKAAPTDEDGKAVPIFQMAFGMFGAPASAGGIEPWRYMESEQNQALRDVTPGVSHGGVSHEREKPA